MVQIKFTIDEAQASFLRDYRQLGFSDESALVRAALDSFQTELVRQQLVDSAVLYAELYAEDAELQKLTESALTGWPQ